MNSPIFYGHNTFLRVSTIEAIVQRSISSFGKLYPRSHNFYDIYRDKSKNEIQITDCSFFNYDGYVNKTKDGIPCLKWKDVKDANKR